MIVNQRSPNRGSFPEEEYKPDYRWELWLSDLPRDLLVFLAKKPFLSNICAPSWSWVALHNSIKDAQTMIKYAEQVPAVDRDGKEFCIIKSVSEFEEQPELPART